MRFGTEEILHNNLMAFLAFQDTVAAILGHVSISYNAIQNMCQQVNVGENALQLLNMVAATNMMILMAITVTCWYNVRTTWTPHSGVKFTKLVAFTFIAILVHAHIRVHWQQKIHAEQLVTIISASFCILTILLFQTIHILQRETIAQERASLTILQHQRMVCELVFRLIHFVIAWAPHLAIIKMLSTSDVYKSTYRTNEHLALSATLALSKSAFDTILACIFNLD